MNSECFSDTRTATLRAGSISESVDGSGATSGRPNHASAFEMLPRVRTTASVARLTIKFAVSRLSRDDRPRPRVSVARRRHSDDSPEVARELALIVEPDAQIG